MSHTSTLVCRYNGLYGQSTGDTLHANRKRYICLAATVEETVNFQNCRRQTKTLSLIRLCPPSVLYIHHYSVKVEQRAEMYINDYKNFNNK